MWSRTALPALLLVCLAGLGASAQPRHFIIIGIDGLSARAVREYDPPAMAALMRRGAYTLHARAAIPTVSSPNWASLIMGAGPAQHGITSNDWQREKHEIPPACPGTSPVFPTFFDVLYRQKPWLTRVIVHDWEGFGRLVDRKTASIRHISGSAAATEAAIVQWQAERPSLLFLHLDDVDHAGHEKGWMSAPYREAVFAVDKLIGRIVEAVGAAGETRTTAILVTADHGGRGTQHGGLSLDELEIPWILAGPGILQGRELTSPINTWDTAATVLALFGAKAPDCWIARPVREALIRP